MKVYHVDFGYTLLNKSSGPMADRNSCAIESNMPLEEIKVSQKLVDEIGALISSKTKNVVMTVTIINVTEVFPTTDEKEIQKIKEARKAAGVDSPEP